MSPSSWQGPGLSLRRVFLLTLFQLTWFKFCVSYIQLPLVWGGGNVREKNKPPPPPSLSCRSDGRVGGANPSLMGCPEPIWASGKASFHPIVFLFCFVFRYNVCPSTPAKKNVSQNLSGIFWNCLISTTCVQCAQRVHCSAHLFSFLFPFSLIFLFVVVAILICCPLTRCLGHISK